ncbi:MAG: choice-of-anchor Q domain-containing protein [Planctomycetota bacterium]|jgi:hypothetical protein
MVAKTYPKTALAISLFLIVLTFAATARAATTADVHNANSVVEDNIEYYMQMDKAVYDVRENVQMLYRVTNLRNEDVTIRFGDQVQHYFAVKQGENLIWDAPKVGFPAASSVVLPPNNYKEYTETWDMTDNQGVLIMLGNYEVTGCLHPVLLSQEDKDRYVPVSISIDIIHEQRTYYVNPGESIQARIDDPNVLDGDTIIVYPGTYVENINFMGKNITLRSAEPTSSDIVKSTTIDGVVCFRGTEDPACMLSGFNIDGYIVGFDYYYGRDHTHATISRCLLVQNRTPCDPAIFACDGTISNCIISWIDTICRAIIPEIEGCHGLIKNCTMVNILGGISILDGGSCTIENCIVYNRAQVSVPSGAMVNISYCDLQGGLAGIVGGGIVNWGPGNIDTDPCFVEPGFWDVWVEGDYHLLTSSPCIDAGDPNYVPEPDETDLDGKPRIIGCRIDMGVFEYGQLVPAEARIVPRTINLASKGKWLTCSISLPEDYNVADIDSDSILLECEIEPESLLVDEQQQVATARFSREDVQTILEEGDIELTITGRLNDGTVFEGTDTIKVIDKIGRKSPN